MSEVLDEEFHAAGFTAAARDFPRCAQGIAAICAWNGIEPGQMPPAWGFYPNAATKAAWERVFAALAAMKEEP